MQWKEKENKKIKAWKKDGEKNEFAIIEHLSGEHSPNKEGLQDKASEMEWIGVWREKEWEGESHRQRARERESVSQKEEIKLQKDREKDRDKNIQREEKWLAKK